MSDEHATELAEHPTADSPEPDGQGDTGPNGSSKEVIKRNKASKRITTDLEPDALDVLDTVAMELMRRGLVAPHEVGQTLLLKILIYTHPIFRCDYEAGLEKLEEAQKRAKKIKKKARSS